MDADAMMRMAVWRLAHGWSPEAVRIAMVSSAPTEMIPLVPRIVSIATEALEMGRRVAAASGSDTPLTSLSWGDRSGGTVRVIAVVGLEMSDGTEIYRTVSVDLPLGTSADRIHEAIRQAVERMVQEARESKHCPLCARGADPMRWRYEIAWVVPVGPIYSLF